MSAGLRLSKQSGASAFYWYFEGGTAMFESIGREFSRRDCLKIGLASLLGVSHSGWLPTLASAGTISRSPRRCILLWMTGGPSQLDTFDPKPGEPTGGPFDAIETSIAGIRICEHLPQVAKNAHELAIIRSMTSKEGDHDRATFLTRTGFAPQGPVRYPSIGSIVAKYLSGSQDKLPNYISISPFPFFNQAAFGPGFLGPAYAPMTVGERTSFAPAENDELRVNHLTPPGYVQGQRMGRRADLLHFLQSEFIRLHPFESAQVHQANYNQALRMVMSQVESAFDLNSEPPLLRDRYGRNRFGQGCLLARRLIERGVSFVEVSLATLPGAPVGWDTHQENFNSVERLCQVLDPAFGTLIEDLKARGLLEETVVVWMGEFGRTPIINGFNGRDHWPDGWTAVLAGGPVRGGQVIGSTGKSGMKIEDRPVTVPELMATICSALGIDPNSENISDEGRPIRLVDNHAQPISEIL